MKLFGTWLLGLLALGGMGVITSAELQGQATLVISEVMADNRSILVDDNGDRSDWVEIWNPTASMVNLAGWSLTDDPLVLQKWVFPSYNLAPNAYLVVFCSGQDRRRIGAPFHTNFRLLKEGDYLALVRPDGNTIATDFHPQFPPQFSDVSYGLGSGASEGWVLVPYGAGARALVPESDALGLEWTKLGFNDSGWKSGTTGVGYDYAGLIGLDVAEMRNANESVYVRIPFQIAALREIDQLILRLQYEDGVVVYLNGEEVTRDNEPEVLTWNSGAPSNRPDATALEIASIDLTSAKDLLRVGSNVLAFHGLNNLVSSSDLLIRPELVGLMRPDGALNQGFFLKPTPGEPNSERISRVLNPVELNPASRNFTGSLTVTLSQAVPGSGAEKIYYTLDGSTPTRESRQYLGPLNLTQTTLVRAIVADDSGGESFIQSEVYERLESDLSPFSSNLPLVVLDTFGGGGIVENTWDFGTMTIHEPSPLRSVLTSEPTLKTRVGLKRRGSSTAGRPKLSMSVEALDEQGRERNISPLGMPAESDWVLWGPYNFDRALMRNPLAYELSNRMGRYAVRTRWVEVFLNTDGNNLSQSDYWGVYVLMEKISRDEDRVDVEKLFPEHALEPEVTGGYILKIDRADPGDSGFNGAGQSLRYVTPKEVEIERPERSAQRQWLSSFFNGFNSALGSLSQGSSTQGVAQYLDTAAAVDHHLLNVLCFNVDALRLSTYMHIPRGGKLTFGPVWDFDRAMGSTDGRDINPNVWRSTSGDRGTDFFNYPWWGRLFSNANFFQEYIDRWWELRTTVFSEAEINGIVDQFASGLREAQVRDLQRWGQTPRFGGYQGEINHLKNWFRERIAFIDGQFVNPPRFSSNPGRVLSGAQIALSSPEGGDIYYTLDGSDPRASGGGIRPGAVRYTGPVTVNSTITFTVRVRNSGHTSLTGANNPPLSSPWSGMVQGRFTVDRAPLPGDLLVTELHYNPSGPTEEEGRIDATWDGDDFEFLELLNTSDDSLDLVGLKWVLGIEFDFSNAGITTLESGGRLVLVSNTSAFRQRYGNDIPIAGEYRGNLNNGGELLNLVGGQGEVLLDFEYRDDWYRTTDGLGFSLALKADRSSGISLSDPSSWGVSAEMGGSPGETNPAPRVFPRIVVNEILTHTDLPDLDSIELMNLDEPPADIGGWWLSDDRAQPFRYRIPEGTVLEGLGWRVWTEMDFNADPLNVSSFSLSSLGEEVWVFSAGTDGKLTGYAHGFQFGASPNGVTLGRYLNGQGEEFLTFQKARTLGAANSGPRIGSVVIEEFLYHPLSEGQPAVVLSEFIEIQNITTSPIALYDEAHPTNRWRLGGGIDFEFPEGMILSGGETVVIVDFDPLDNGLLTSFRQRYPSSLEARILGPFMGRLDNSGEWVRLERPDSPQMPLGNDPAVVPYYEEDAVRFKSVSPWPADASGTGKSIHRRPVFAFGTDAEAWNSGDPMPGLGANVEVTTLLLSVSRSEEGDLVLSFTSEVGLEYFLWTSDRLELGAFQNQGKIETPETGGVVSLNQNIEVGNRFFQIRAQNP